MGLGLSHVRLLIFDPPSQVTVQEAQSPHAPQFPSTIRQYMNFRWSHVILTIFNIYIVQIIKHFDITWANVYLASTLFRRRSFTFFTSMFSFLNLSSGSTLSSCATSLCTFSPIPKFSPFTIRSYKSVFIMSNKIYLILSDLNIIHIKIE